jgi:hypothetical protein
MQALGLMITPDAVPARLAEAGAVAPVRDDAPDRPDGVPPATAQASVPAAVEVGQPTGADTRERLRERLAPRMTDRRLWFEPVHISPEDADEAGRIHAPIRDGVAALNDSIAADEAAARQATDWTARDGEGNRWGISPDRVHLGGLTVKLRHCTVEPCEGWLFPAPADRKDEYENRRRGFAEIRLQAARAELQEARGARATAIRKRLDAQRDSSRGGGP